MLLENVRMANEEQNENIVAFLSLIAVLARDTRQEFCPYFCTTLDTVVPIIDPGNARGEIYKTGVTADGKAVLASSFYGHGVQRKNDGIGAGGFRHQSQTGMGSVCDGIEKAELRGHTGKTGDNNECQTNKIEEPVRTNPTTKARMRVAQGIAQG